MLSEHIVWSRRSRVWGAALTLVAVGGPLGAQGRVVLPAGSVIIVRTESPLQSASVKSGQTFETRVSETVGVDEYSVIPSGSRIRGVVSAVRPATRQQSGVIDVVFDQLTLPDGTTLPITGKLTSTDSAERRQIESDPNNRRVVLVGGRGGIGAAIAGAGAQQGANNILAALGGLLSEGRDVNVPAGTSLAVELERAVTLRGRGRVRGDAFTIYTAPERIRAAQSALAQRNYYRGAVNGTLDDATRRALFEFQVDQGLSGTGNLDGRTARALGLNLALGSSGAALTAEQASALRRDAQALVARARTELGGSSVGRLDPSRTYAQSDLELWYALSAFADNASIHEQIVRNGGNTDAAVLAGRALAGAARRVDAAMQAARVSSALRSAWTSLRQPLAALDSQSNGG